jgi:hypothetical protein
MWSLSLGFSHQNPVNASPLSHMRYMSSQSHSSQLYHQKTLVELNRLLSSSLYSFFHFHVTSSLLAQICSVPYSQTPSACVPRSM